MRAGRNCIGRHGWVCGLPRNLHRTVSSRGGPARVHKIALDNRLNCAIPVIQAPPCDTTRRIGVPQVESERAKPRHIWARRRRRDVARQEPNDG